MIVPQTKLPKVGTTIFTVMSQLATEHGAVNLGQGFPDFPVPARLVDELAKAMHDGRNQYAPMTGIPALRQAIAAKTKRCYGRDVDADAEVTVTSGASEAIFDAIHALVRPGGKWSCSIPATTATSRRSTSRARRRCTCRWIRSTSPSTGTACAPRSRRARGC
jgi:aspartate/methionine/tyrosine aminotransferase